MHRSQQHKNGYADSASLSINGDNVEKFEDVDVDVESQMKASSSYNHMTDSGASPFSPGAAEYHQMNHVINTEEESMFSGHKAKESELGAAEVFEGQPKSPAPDAASEIEADDSQGSMSPPTASSEIQNTTEILNATHHENETRHSNGNATALQASGESGPVETPGHTKINCIPRIPQENEVGRHTI